MTETPPRGLLLLSMGAPRSPDDVLPYLEGLFGDPRVIDLPLPGFLRRWITGGMARRRAPEARKRYDRLGGGSPLAPSIERLTQKVEELLRRDGESWHVAAAFRYLPPTVRDGIERLKADGCHEIHLCPLHPHRSRPTTGSLLALAEEASSSSSSLSLLRTPPFLDEPGYLEMLEEAVRAWLGAVNGHGEKEEESKRKNQSEEERERRAELGSQSCPVLCIAHSVPRRLERSGDPYVGEIRRTVSVLTRSFPHLTTRLCWQGQVGPMKWVGPSLEETWPILAEEGVKEVGILPLSFLFDHVETLVELDVDAVEDAARHGIHVVARMPLFSESPALVDLVANLARREGLPLKEDLL